MTNPTPISPAAQAVMDAWWNEPGSNQKGIAKVLRAAADQVVEEVSPVEAILAIAAELEKANA